MSSILQQLLMLQLVFEVGGHQCGGQGCLGGRRVIQNHYPPRFIRLAVS